MGRAELGDMSLALDVPIPDLTDDQLIDGANALTRAAGLAQTLVVTGIVQSGGVLILRVHPSAHTAVMESLHDIADRFIEHGITVVVIASDIEPITATADSAIGLLAAENRRLQERLAALEPAA